MRAGFLVYSLFLILFINAVSAVAFTASSNPTGLNAGQSSQLLNFTVSNIGSVNVTQLNITLFPTFTFTGSSSTTTSSPYTASSSSPSWINSSSIGIVGNGATQYFSVYVNTPSATGNYGFNISTLDASGTLLLKSSTLWHPHIPATPHHRATTARMQ
jgi:hypothetical protein